jgi:TetR/AcrR family transcriptional repressor of nem operon
MGMDLPGPEKSGNRRLTARGAATRLRIVEAASQLMRGRGVGATRMEDVVAASGTSKSQLYHHFADKDALVQAVIMLRGDSVLEFHREALSRCRSVRGLERWRDVVVGRVSAVHGAFGCQLGSLAAEIVDENPEARAVIAAYFKTWTRLFEDCLTNMKESGELTEEADARHLAGQIMAALQGGYLLSQVEHSSEPMRFSLDMAIDQVRRFQSSREPNDLE